MLAGKKALLKHRKFKEVSIDDDQSVGILELTGKQREIVANETMSAAGKNMILPEGMQAKILRWCVVGDDKKPLFNAEDEDDIAAMGGSTVEKLILAIFELSGLTESSMDDLAKNSESDLNAGPGSASQKSLAAV